MIYISVIIGAIIGYVTNYLAIKMLFRPYKPKKFIITIHGIIPAQKEKLAQSIANMIEQYLLDEETLHKLIKNSSLQQEISEFIHSQIQKLPDLEQYIKNNPQKVATNISEFVMEMIQTKFPFAAAIINQELVYNMVVENIDVLASKMASVVDVEELINPTQIQEDILIFLSQPQFIKDLNISQLIFENIKNFDEAELENMLFAFMKEHFRFINIAGAVLGGIIGFIQACIIMYMH
ncbi:MAG: DUF445 family protein [Epsilonproteobacteria bacterium]|jgi:uncharacterized membrane protein YheB (UPF0754 family)|nr:DUF445 family protein [Campylobacterota bacterium]